MIEYKTKKVIIRPSHNEDELNPTTSISLIVSYLKKRERRKDDDQLIECYVRDKILVVTEIFQLKREREKFEREYWQYGYFCKEREFDECVGSVNNNKTQQMYVVCVYEWELSNHWYEKSNMLTHIQCILILINSRRLKCINSMHTQSDIYIHFLLRRFFYRNPRS